MSSDRELIRDTLERWAAAVRAGDVDAIVEAHSDQIRLFDVPPPTQRRGLDAYRQSWEREFMPSTEPGRFDLDELEFVVGSHVAFAHGVIHCTHRPAGEPAEQIVVRLTVGLQRIDGRWTITHEHHSVPATD